MNTITYILIFAFICLLALAVVPGCHSSAKRLRAVHMKGEPTDPLHLTRLSQVTIEPFTKDNLNNANIPPELNEDETGLIKRKID